MRRDPCTATGLLLLAWSVAACAPDQEPTTREDAADVVETNPGVTTTKGPVSVTMRMDPEVPRLSDEPRLTLELRSDPDVDVHLPPFQDALGSFVIRDFTEDLPVIEDGIRVQRQHYRLEPTDVGMLEVPPLDVGFVDGRTTGDQADHVLTTEPFPVEVASIVGDGVPSLNDLRPMADPLSLPPPAPVPVRRSPWWWALPAGVVLLGLLIVWRVRRKPPPPPPLTPRQRAEQEFAALTLDDPLGRGDVKTYYVELTQIVRRFIERTTSIRAPEQTTEEFLRATQFDGRISDERKDALREFLTSADLVKFAAVQPTASDLRTTWEAAHSFCDLSAPAAQPTEAAS